MSTNNRNSNQRLRPYQRPAIKRRGRLADHDIQLLRRLNYGSFQAAHLLSSDERGQMDHLASLGLVTTAIHAEHGLIYDITDFGRTVALKSPRPHK